MIRQPKKRKTSRTGAEVRTEGAKGLVSHESRDAGDRNEQPATGNSERAVNSFFASRLSTDRSMHASIADPL